MKTTHTLSIIGLALTVSAVTTSTSAIAADVINGNSCRAANLAQANKLQWDHARIYNPGPTSLWVTCAQPVTARYTYDSASSNNKLYGQGNTTVSVWFGASASPGASVTCIARDLNDNMTGTLAAKAITHVISAPGSLPGVAKQGFDYKDAGFYMWGIGIGVSYSHTISCLLPPHTGINAMSALMQL